MRDDYTTITPQRVDEHLLVLYFDRPERANAMNTQMGIELRAFFQDMYVDQEDVRVIVVTGRGAKAFSAGGDLKDRNGMTDQQWQHQHAIYEQMVRGLRDCPVPVIAAVNGAAFGGGCEFALGCDFIYAASTARFALTEVTLGIMPGAAGTINLPHAVGERRAREIVYTGAPFTATEALDWGLVNKVCKAESLLEDTLATAGRIAANAPVSIRQAKKSIALATQVDRNSAYMFELEAYNRMVPTADRLEGVRAFNEKRKPRFEGR